MQVELAQLIWVLIIVGITLVGGYAMGHNEGYKTGTENGYRRGAKSVNR